MFAEFGVLNFWTYVVGAFFIVLVPGPNTLFVLKTELDTALKKGTRRHGCIYRRCGADVSCSWRASLH